MTPNQGDMFAPGDACALRDEGIKRAADHADAVAPDWTDNAFRIFCHYGKQRAQKGFLFSTEEARTYAEKWWTLPPPPDRRAWGAVAVRARRAGLIQRAGFDCSKSANCHGGYIAVWRWVGPTT